MLPVNRQFSRFTLRLPASLSYQEERIDVIVTNLSVGGAFLETEKQLMLESELQLSVELPEPTHHLNVRARVVWKQPEGLGLSFERLKPIDVWSLLKLESALAAGKLSFDEEMSTPEVAHGAGLSEEDTSDSSVEEQIDGSLVGVQNTAETQADEGSAEAEIAGDPAEVEADESSAVAETEDTPSGEAVESLGEQSEIKGSTEGIKDEAESSEEQ